MSVSKRWVWSRVNVDAVLKMYRSRDIPTIDQIARDLGTRTQNVSYVIREHMAERERRALAVLRYSASKTGDKNPMTNKRLSKHHNWKGECDDGKGYKTIKTVDGRRMFVHQKIVLDALGLKRLPKGMEVHHIDENPTNNNLDNLVITTSRGHKALHWRYRRDSKALRLRNLKIAEATRYLTSQ